MAKFDLSSIVNDVQKLYAKDKKSQSMITTGDSVRQAFEAKDGIPLPAGFPLLKLTGLPCLPYNKLVQIAGAPDTGKSTICGQTMAEAQRSGHIVVLWDSEDKFDAHRFNTQFGGVSKDVLLVKTNEILQGGEKVTKLITAIKERYPDAKILLVWDSVGGSQSRSHAERELDNEKHAQPGQDAKENGSVMRKLVGMINKYPDSIAVLMANQVYAKIGFMQVGDAAAGGKKIEFHSSLIIFLKRVKTLTKITKGQQMKVGITTRATVSKNHLTQSAVSVYKMDFDITAAGANESAEQSCEDDEE